jgi:hypothetical protein
MLDGDRIKAMTYYSKSRLRRLVQLAAGGPSVFTVVSSLDGRWPTDRRRTRIL